MGTKCKSEMVIKGSSLSPTRCFSPSRGFLNRDAGHSDDEGADPLDFDVCGSIKDVTAPNLPLTQKSRLVPYYGVHRDKESLLEEVLALLNAFQEQKFHSRAHKMHRNAVHAVNSKLESQIEFLETSGLEAARTGTLTKLTSKLKGAKFRIAKLEMTCAANLAEVRRLRMHAQVMKTREVTVQREEFATEVRRLQKFIFYLRNIYKKILDDNKEVARLKEEIPKLTAKNQELETSVAGMGKSVQEMTTESAKWKSKGVAAKYARETDDKRFLTLQDDNKSLIDLLFAEKLAQKNFTTMVNELGHQVRMVERETRERKTLQRGAALSDA